MKTIKSTLIKYKIIMKIKDLIDSDLFNYENQYRTEEINNFKGDMIDAYDIMYDIIETETLTSWSQNYWKKVLNDILSKKIIETTSEEIKKISNNDKIKGIFLNYESEICICRGNNIKQIELKKEINKPEAKNINNKIITKTSEQTNKELNINQKRRTCPECGKLTPFVFDHKEVKKIGLFKKELKKYQTFKCKNPKCGCQWRIDQ